MMRRAAALIALAALCEGYGLSPAPRCATRRAVGALLPAGCWLLGRDAAAGACLPSDLSEECIGVYKERSTDVTREDARAAGIRWAEQPTFAKPREAARALRRERATVTAWRRDGDLVAVGTSLLRVRPVVGAAAEAVGAKLDRETAKLWAKAVDASLFAFDAADVALGYAIRERDAREVVARSVAADDLLKVAVDEYLQLLRFLDVVAPRAAQESEIPNFKGSDLGHFPLVSADFWTSDHLSERSRSVDMFSVTRARETLTLKRR